MSSRTRMSMSMSMPCAACKILRRRCTTNCIFLPYFPASESEKFAAVHQVFGAVNFSKLLRRIPNEYREDAVQSLVYEARARLRDPIYGSVGLIASLQRQVLQLNAQLDAAIAEATLLNAQLTQTTNSQPIIDYPLQLHTYPPQLQADSDTNFSAYDIGLHQL